MTRPNVLLVFADQWTWWTLGCNGNREVRTPHLDAFAARAVNCHRAISGSPVCTPARASLLTGLRPHAHGLFLNDAPLNPELPSIGKHFAAAGYDTAWIGKWHVDGHGRTSYIPPERRHGFQHFLALECTHNYNRSRYYADDDAEVRTWPGYDAFCQTDALINWIGTREGKPFFGVLSWGPPHNPYDSAPAEYQAHFAPEAVTLRGNVAPAREADARRDLAGYYAHCEALDDAFGRLMAALDARGLREKTIVVFTSDHGNMLGSHGLSEKQCPWDESLRIPFLAAGPGLPIGTRNDTLIEFMDLWPTLAGLAGIEQPTGLHARDHSAHLQAGTVPADNAGLYASYARFGTWRGQDERVDPLHRSRESRGLRTPSHLYAEDLDGPWLLFDTEADPLQQTNLVASPSHAHLRAQLADRLRARLAACGDEFLPGPELIARWGYVVDNKGTIPIGNWRD